jgi:F0F1-type ATP synthase delta subunit
VEKVDFILPLSVATPTDLGRLLREAESLHDFLEQAAIRKTGEPMKMPKTSRMLDELMQTNKMNGLQSTERQKLIKWLTAIKKKAPVVHISFGADPSPVFLQKLVAWFRQNIHQFLMIRVGLQPNIGAGCMIRTNNKVFDMSLRQYFKKHYQYFVDHLHAVMEDPKSSQESPATSQQPTADGQQPPADSQQPPASSHLPTADGQQQPVDSQQSSVNSKQGTKK